MNIAKTPATKPILFKPRPSRNIQILARAYRRGARLDLHMHREAQLLFAGNGLMQVETPKGRWLVPPDRAVWVAPKLPHAIDFLADTEMRTVYFQPRWLAANRASRQLRDEFVVRVAPLLREIIAALFDGRTEPARQLLLARLAIQELESAGDSTTFMPMPSDAKARAVAEMILRNPADSRDLEALSRQGGLSGRTLTRLFPLQTQLTFKSWRQRARIIAAIELLGRQASIKRIAAKLGFASTAAFSHAFRQVTGETPTAFLDRRVGASSGSTRPTEHATRQPVRPIRQTPRENP